MKKKAFVLVLSSLILSAYQPLQAETLRNVLCKTVHTNPDIRVAAKIRSASNETVTQARAGYFPTLDMNAGFGREWTKNTNTGFNNNKLWRTDFGLSARQMLFDGFATPSEVARNKAKTNADAYKVWGTSEDIALSTIQAYLDVLRNKELVRVARQNASIHQHTFSMIKKASEQGVAREADTDQTLGRLNLARANLEAAENNLENAKTTFQKLTGFYPHNLSSAPNVSSSVLPKNKQEAIRRALLNHPILKSATADIAEARGEYHASQSKFYPRIDLVGRGRHNRNVNGSAGPDHEGLVGLELQYNLLQGGRDMARTRETAFHVQEATEIRNRTHRQVVESMNLAWTQYRISQQRIPLLSDHVQASRLTSGAYKKQFELGKRTLLDVLDSQNEYYVSQQDLINERYALLFSKYRILNSMGRLVEHFHIPLPPEARIPYETEEDSIAIFKS